MGALSRRYPDGPGAGHLVQHMAAHIYLRLGRYHDVSEANRKAIEADLAHLRRTPVDPAYAVGHLAHNYHFLWFSLTMEGRDAEAMEVAAKLAGRHTRASCASPAPPSCNSFARCRISPGFASGAGRKS